MGMYCIDMCYNMVKIVVNVGVCEQIEFGVGVWCLVIQYEDNDLISNNQVIRCLLIYEVCLYVIWDVNSKQMDKSDVKYCMVINVLLCNGWKEFVEDYGIDLDILLFFQNFNDIWLFLWVLNDVVYVVEYYEVEEKKERVFIYCDLLIGELVSYYQQDIKDVIDDLVNCGFIKVVECKVKCWCVYKLIIICMQILKDCEKIVGEYILIVLVYGEWLFVGDKECYEGVVRLMKDG